MRLTQAFCKKGFRHKNTQKTQKETLLSEIIFVAFVLFCGEKLSCNFIA